ncbi:MAG: long-chain fatty acid--CoA ligase [Clostridiales bacterium]|nr:long-chain fatty acid--CoA ligase [Clostridiales bacterium]
MAKNEKIFDAIEFKNIKEIIYNSAKVYSENIAYVIKHVKDKKVTYENISYKRLLEDVNKLGTALYKLGMKGKRIAIIGKNRYEWTIAYLANLLGGIVAVPLDKDLQHDELENSLIRSKADCIFFDEKLVDKISEIKENKKTNLSEYICMSEIEGYKSVKELLIQGEKLINSGEKEYLEAEIDENIMNVLLFTSGTTSESKAVMLSQKNIASNIYAMQCVEDIRYTDTNIAFLPFHHIFGSTGMLMMLACGVKTVFPDGLKYIKQNLNEYKVSLFIGVPVLIEAIYKAVMKEIEKQGKTKLIKVATVISNFLLKFKIDIRRKIFKQVINALGGELRMLISGGAPADARISKGFIDLGIKVVQGYGLSETAPVVAAENAKYVRSGSVGKTMLNDIVEVVNKDENGVGELRVKGPNVMLGYYEMPELTNEVIKDGWFYTGDLAYIDKDGFIFITGRNKNMIVLRNGKKVFPEEMETLINRLDLVEECMVFGLPEKDDKNDVKIAVKVVYSNKEKTEDEIYQILWEQIKKINKTLPKYKYIQKLILTDEELIKTTTKKVKRNEEMKKILQRK